MSDLYYFYIARCRDDSLYCGYCKDLIQREKAHNEGTGSKYTRGRLPLHFVYHEEFPTRSAAMKREYAVKQWTRVAKEELLLHSANPRRPVHT